METIITAPFRVSYPNVFTPKLNELSGKTEYSLVALFPEKADIENLKKMAAEAVKKKWGDKRPKKLRSPFRDQAEREKEVDDGQGGSKLVMPDGYVKGAIMITFKSNQAPGIVDAKNQPIIDAENFYAGCWARAEVSCAAYDKAGNTGVAFYVQNLQKVKDDDPFSGRRKAEDAFAPVDGGDAAQSDVSSTGTDDIFGS